MKEEMTVSIREAIPSDATEILHIMREVGKETPYLVLDEEGMALSKELLELNLGNIYESANNILLVGLVDEKIIGTASVRASSAKRVEHIGEVGISILKDYWGFGLGTAMLEELLGWAEESKIIRRLELTVQQRNVRAIHVYQKLGFTQEAIMHRGAQTDDGEMLDVVLMSIMID